METLQNTPRKRTSYHQTLNSQSLVIGLILVSTICWFGVMNTYVFCWSPNPVDASTA